MSTIAQFRSFDRPVQLLLINQLSINIGFYMLIPYLAGYLAGDLGLAVWVVGLVLGVRNFAQQGMFLIGGTLADRLGYKPLNGARPIWVQLLRFSMSAFPSRATLLVAVISAVVATLASCGYSATVAPAAPPSPKAATAADPRTGVAYPFELHTHCGISTAGFGGRDWQAIMPQPQPAPVLRSAPDGTVIHTDHTVGTMTLVSPDLLRFSYDGGSVDFTQFPAGPHPACA